MFSRKSHRIININEALAGMELADTVITDDATMMLSPGTVLTSQLIDKLKQWDINVIVIKTVLNDQETNLQAEEFYQDYTNTVQSVKSTFESMRLLKKIPIDDLLDLQHTHINPMLNSVGVINYLYTVQHLDDYTYHHSVNVGVLAGVLGRWVGYFGVELDNLVLAGLLHDVGKTQVPLSILNKPGSLSEKEMHIMKMHTIFGYRMLSEITSIPEEVVLGALEHHERMDGSGYPLKLSGRKIHSYAKIIAIVDVYDAMTSNRVYRKKTTPFETVEVLARAMFDKFDPEYCQVFLASVCNFMLGNMIKLSDGRMAKVIKLGNYFASRPIVQTEDNEFIDLEKFKHIGIVDVVQA